MTDIRLRSITKSYRERKILSNVDLDIADGTILALLGPSGSGKTTLLRLIAGFERPDDGEISLGSLVADSRHAFVPPEHRHVGYVPQEGALFPHLTVADNIAYGLRERQHRASRLREMLHLTGLEDQAEKYPRELSGGQQQRVALARALAPKPAVVILDEPFSALDLDMRRYMNAEVTSLLRSVGATALLVTHDPVEAFACADAVAILHGGAIAQCGSPEQVYRTPVSREVAKLTGRTIFLEGTMHGGKAHTLLGIIDVAAPYPDNGSNVSVLIRPEDFEISPRMDGIISTITKSLFLGNKTILTVKTNDMMIELETTHAPKEKNISLHLRNPAQVFILS